MKKKSGKAGPHKKPVQNKTAKKNNVKKIVKKVVKKKLVTQQPVKKVPRKKSPLRTKSNILLSVRRIVAEQAKKDLDEVQPDSSFVNDLRCDSLDSVEIVMEIEEEFGISIPDDVAEKLQTCAQCADYLAGLPNRRKGH